MADIPNDFFKVLEKKYKDDADLKASWRHEEPILKKVIGLVNDEISYNYEFETPLGIGGSGVVASVHDVRLKVKRAIKISRPSKGKEEALAKVLFNEAEKLKRLSHTNLIRIFAQETVTHDEVIYPYYVMEYVEDAKESGKYFKQEGLKQEDVLKVLLGVVSAICYIHSQDTIHLDIKPENILITPDGTPIISDLGFAKFLTIGESHTIIGGTDGYIHPEARELVKELKTNPNRLQGEARRKILKKTWDLFSLGKTFLRLLEILDKDNPKVLSSYARRYIKLLACRLLDGHNNTDERAIGLSIATLNEIKYTSIEQVKIDLEKLTGSYNLGARIPELNLHIQDTIQASTLAITPFTIRVAELLGHPAFTRLGTCTQLGLLNLIYPTATHTRFEHTIGTFSVLCRFILALYNDPLNPLFCQIMDEEDLRAGLLASLLHDIGQYSLAHDLEEANNKIFSHETIGKSILKDKKNSLCKLIEKEDGWNVQSSRVISILEADPVALRGNLKDRILRSLVNGPIDADKIDYLMRDSQMLGLNYGKSIDIERLLKCLTVVCEDSDDQTYAALGIHEKGKVPAEAIIFARYAMFGQVYWHHTHRSIKAMLHRMIWDMCSSEKGSLTTLTKKFREFVLPITDESLLPFTTNQNRELSRIQEGDLNVLRWIASRSGETGKEFLNLIETRALFKRVLVLSHDRAKDKKLWDKMTKFYREGDWQKKRKLQEIFQRKIVEMVESPPDTLPRTDVITDDARNNFIADGKKKVLLLVDLPPVRKGADMPLKYLVEEDRRRIKIDEMQVGNLEESVVWRALQENFQESIGKLRVYCHPEYSKFISAYLSRQRIEEALFQALAATEGESD